MTKKPIEECLNAVYNVRGGGQSCIWKMENFQTYLFDDNANTVTFVKLCQQIQHKFQRAELILEYWVKFFDFEVVIFKVHRD